MRRCHILESRRAFSARDDEPVLHACHRLYIVILINNYGSWHYQKANVAPSLVTTVSAPIVDIDRHLVRQGGLFNYYLDDDIYYYKEPRRHALLLADYHRLIILIRTWHCGRGSPPAVHQPRFGHALFFPNMSLPARSTCGSSTCSSSVVFTIDAHSLWNFQWRYSAHVDST